MWVAIPLDLGLNQSGITTHFAGRLRQVEALTMTIRIPVTNCSCGDSHLQTIRRVRKRFAENLNARANGPAHSVCWASFTPGDWRVCGHGNSSMRLVGRSKKSDFGCFGAMRKRTPFGLACFHRRIVTPYAQCPADFISVFLPRASRVAPVA
jgi:hypothetical protein